MNLAFLSLAFLLGVILSCITTIIQHDILYLIILTIGIFVAQQYPATIHKVFIILTTLLYSIIISDYIIVTNHIVTPIKF